MHDSNQCAECGRAIDAPEQHFCPACGQPTPAHRIDWHFLGHELEHSVLHMDRGLLYTLKNLLLRPGPFIRNYIEGRRAGYVRPMMLITLMAAVVTLVSKYMVHGEIVKHPDTLAGTHGDKADAAALAHLMNVVTDWTNQHYAAATLLLLPLEAAAFRLAFRRFRALNYPEWLTITAFLTGQSFLIQTVSIVCDRWIPGRSTWAGLLVIAFASFSLVQFFDDYPKWKSALRALWAYALFQGAMLLLGIVLAVVLLLVGRFHAG